MILTLASQNIFSALLRSVQLFLLRRVRADSRGPRGQLRPVRGPLLLRGLPQAAGGSEQRPRHRRGLQSDTAPDDGLNGIAICCYKPTYSSHLEAKKS